MSNIKYILITLLLLYSCSENRDTSETNPVLSIKATVDPDNKLRINIDVILESQTEVRIEFWEKNSQKEHRLSRISAQSSEHRITLVVLKPLSVYYYKIWINGTAQQKLYEFKTGGIPEELMSFKNTLEHSRPSFDGYIHLASKEKGVLYLIDDSGNIVWYQTVPEKGVICSNFDKSSSTFQAIIGHQPNTNFSGSRIYEVDLYGKSTLNIPWYDLKNGAIHHDIYRLASGCYAVINFITKEFNLTKWGGSSNESVVGDGFSIIDRHGNTIWEWSCFDHISPTDDPKIMGDKGEYEFSPREDWLHANSLIEDSEGYFFITFNKLNQIWKIAPQTGEVVYKLGANNDFNLPESSAPQHLHAVSTPSKDRVMVLDNGAVREQSRALIYDVNPKNNTASVTLDVLLPKQDYSRNQSSVYLMPDNRLLFGSSIAQSIVITDLEGAPIWRHIASEQFFRTIYIENNNIENQ